MQKLDKITYMTILCVVMVFFGVFILPYSDLSPPSGRFKKAMWEGIYDGVSIQTLLANLDNLKDSETWIILACVAQWQHDHSLMSHFTDAELKNFIDTFKEADSRFEVHAYVYSQYGTTPIDLTKPEYRQACANASAAYVDKGFDGIHDDMEARTGDYLDFLNRMATALRAKGKKSSAALFPWEPNSFYQGLQLDYAYAMCYTYVAMEEGNFKKQVDRILSHISVPTFIGVINRDPYIATQLGWLDQQLAVGEYPKFVGVSVYRCGEMRSEDWAG